MSTLRSSLIRLASERPELRAHLLPLLGARGKRASDVQRILSDKIILAIQTAVRPVVNHFTSVPLVAQYEEGVIDIFDLMAGLKRKTLGVNSPEKIIGMYEAGVIDFREMGDELEAFDSVPVVHQYLEGIIPIQDLKKGLKIR